MASYTKEQTFGACLCPQILDKMIGSQFVDLKNISSGRYAGATTAAQFIERFVPPKTKWAHLDIAGMAFSKYGGVFNRPGATGFGLLLMADPFVWVPTV